MYLNLEGVPGEKDPLVIVVLAWSHGFSSTADSPVQAPKTDLINPDAWSFKDVGDWLRKNNLDSFVAEFEKNEISGKEVLSVSAEDLKEMGLNKIGQKLRFFNAQNDLALAKDKYKRSEEGFFNLILKSN